MQRAAAKRDSVPDALKNQRLRFIDGLRGIAATVVMVLPSGGAHPCCGAHASWLPGRSDLLRAFRIRHHLGGGRAPHEPAFSRAFCPAPHDPAGHPVLGEYRAGAVVDAAGRRVRRRKPRRQRAADRRPPFLSADAAGLSGDQQRLLDLVPRGTVLPGADPLGVGGAETRGAAALLQHRISGAVGPVGAGQHELDSHPDRFHVPLLVGLRPGGAVLLDSRQAGAGALSRACLWAGAVFGAPRCTCMPTGA